MVAVLELPTNTTDADTAQPELNHDEIERRAYFRYLDRGCEDGLALDDWIAAETELRQENALHPAIRTDLTERGAESSGHAIRQKRLIHNRHPAQISK